MYADYQLHDKALRIVLDVHKPLHAMQAIHKSFLKLLHHKLPSHIPPPSPGASSNSSTMVPTLHPPLVPAVNILLLGAAGAGKSSLISTLDSLLRGVITRRAPSGTATASLTMKVRRYAFRAGPTALPLCLWDTRGWCPTSYRAGGWAGM
jgi:hypothetical protein